MPTKNFNSKKLSCIRYCILIISLSISLHVSGSKSNTISDTSKQYITKTMVNEGVLRSYHIYMPKNFNKNTPAPMVLAIHGGGGNGRKFEEQVSGGTLTAAAEKRGVVLVFPEGIKKRWNAGRPEVFNGEKMYDDLGFISNLIDEMVQNYNIDPKRVYATGISNGGFMCVRLALDLSSKIAAVAPVTSQISRVNKDKYPELPISIMIINGTADRLVPFKGGHVRPFRFGRSKGIVLSTQKSIDMFSKFNKCKFPAERQSLPDKVPDDRTNVVIMKYSECENNTEVVLVKVIGGGHTWPSGVQYLAPRLVGVVSKEINASEMILDFFLSHARKSMKR